MGAKRTEMGYTGVAKTRGQVVFWAVVQILRVRTLALVQWSVGLDQISLEACKFEDTSYNGYAHRVKVAKLWTTRRAVLNWGAESRARLEHRRQSYTGATQGLRKW